MAQPSPTFDNDRVVADFPKNARETVRVTLRSFNNRDLVDVRTWYYGPDGETLLPGKGLTLSAAKLPELRAALDAAAAAMGAQL